MALDWNADISKMSLEQMSDYRRRMAETVNRQMRRLTKAGYTKGNAMAAQADPWLKRQGRTRFSTLDRPQSVQEYAKTASGTRKLSNAEIVAKQKQRERAEIEQMRKFHRSQTYTKAGIDLQRRRARESLAKRFGYEYSEDEVDEMFEMDAFSWLVSVKGSLAMQAVARAINDGQVTAKEAANRINQMREKYKKTEDFQNMTIDKMFEEMDIPFKPEYIQIMPVR